jgi:Uma2 family endonuclease
MVITEKQYTTKEFHTYAAQHPDKLLELINGRIVEKVTTEEHGYIVINIGAELRTWVRHTNIKGYYSTEAAIELPDDDKNHRRPDVSFRLTDDEMSKEGVLSTMPDFAVEVVSPTNSLRELREKAEFYMANGVRLVWLVYPARRVVEVYFADGSVDIFTDDMELSGGDVLPGFKMLVRDLFEN